MGPGVRAIEPLDVLPDNTICCGNELIVAPYVLPQSRARPSMCWRSSPVTLAMLITSSMIVKLCPRVVGTDCEKDRSMRFCQGVWQLLRAMILPRCLFRQSWRDMNLLKSWAAAASCVNTPAAVIEPILISFGSVASFGT